MIEVTTMVRGKGTGMLIRSLELLGVAATKLRSQAQGRIGWQQMRAELIGHGLYRDVIRSLHTSLRMALSVQTLHRVVLPVWHMACIRYSP